MAKKVNGVTQEFKDEMMSVNVTLDGKPAWIRGRLCEFAAICIVDSAYSVQFAWPTVKRIVEEKDGKFFS